MKILVVVASASAEVNFLGPYGKGFALTAMGRE